jgi:hypothetical protein
MDSILHMMCLYMFMIYLYTTVNIHNPSSLLSTFKPKVNDDFHMSRILLALYKNMTQANIVYFLSYIIIRHLSFQDPKVSGTSIAFGRSHVCHVLITVVGLQWHSVNTGFCENQLQAILQFFLISSFA